MAHPRKLIRHAVRDLLLEKTSGNHVTAADDRVTTTQILPFRRSELPAISIYTLDEETNVEQSSAIAPVELVRELELVIAGWVEAGSNVDDAMDDLALEIEAAMGSDPYLGGLTASAILLSTTMDPRGEGDSLIGLITLTYGVTYRSAIPELPVSDEMDDFLRAGVTYQPPGTIDDEAARDEVVVQVEEGA